jgi:hypothetical protein
VWGKSNTLLTNNLVLIYDPAVYLSYRRTTMRYIRAWRDYKRQLFPVNPDLIDVSVYLVILLSGAFLFHAPIVGVVIVVCLMIYDLYLSYKGGKKLLGGK